MKKIVIFVIAKQRYGMDIQYVNSIERVPKMTEIPQTPDFVKGVIDLRGSIIPIIDLKNRLGMGESTFTSKTRVIIVSIDQVQVGLLVDDATDVLDIDSSSIDASVQLASGKESTYIDGVAKLEDELLVMLDVESLLIPEEIRTVQGLVEELT